MGAVIIQGKEQMISIIKSSLVCCIGMVDENQEPYVLPFNFGIDDEFLWFHSAKTGRKIEILKKNPKVCVSFSNNYQLGFRHEHVACSYFMKYKSVLVYGNVEFIDDYELKVYGMNVIMKQYTNKSDFKYNPPAINNVEIFRLKIEKMTGRAYL